MVELEVYAAGIREADRAIALGHELEALQGLRYKVDAKHDIVYLEMDQPLHTTDAIRRAFGRIGLKAQFVGAIPPECRPKSKTQLLRGTE